MYPLDRVCVRPCGQYLCTKINWSKCHKAVKIFKEKADAAMRQSEKDYKAPAKSRRAAQMLAWGVNMGFWPDQRAGMKKGFLL